MAKRKRLGPAVGLGMSDPAAAPQAERPSARAPIASIAQDAAAAAAFDAVRDELDSAQRDGRMVQTLPLAAIDQTYLIRDRIEMGPEEMDSLMDSLRRRGQQTPIDVVDLGAGRYGLISGARRMLALDRLWQETGRADFATVRALLRRPDDRAATYVAMVEENEIRAGLSYYERARIAQRAVEAGVFDSPKTALQSLFAGVSFSKRSKIKSFMALVEAFDDLLQFPAQITERQGLALVKALAADPQLVPRMRAALTQTPAADPAQEAACLAAQMAAPVAAPQAPAPVVTTVAQGVRMQSRPGRIVLEGAALTPDVAARLEEVIRAHLA